MRGRIFRRSIWKGGSTPLFRIESVVVDGFELRVQSLPSPSASWSLLHVELLVCEQETRQVKIGLREHTCTLVPWGPIFDLRSMIYEAIDSYGQASSNVSTECKAFKTLLQPTSLLRPSGLLPSLLVFVVSVVFWSEGETCRPDDILA